MEDQQDQMWLQTWAKKIRGHSYIEFFKRVQANAVTGAPSRHSRRPTV
jgi:hypothetical protein